MDLLFRGLIYVSLLLGQTGNESTSEDIIFDEPSFEEENREAAPLEEAKEQPELVLPSAPQPSPNDDDNYVPSFTEADEKREQGQPAPSQLPSLEQAKPAQPEPSAPQKAKIQDSPEKAIIQKVPDDWFQSTTNLFEYCVDVRFAHPICPQINRSAFGAVDFRSEFFAAPTGSLNSRSLFQAQVLYQVNRVPSYWLVGLNLTGKRPKEIPARLWAEAQLLWAQVLHDKGQIKEALALYDRLVDEFKGRGLFHQQRAWVQFKSKQFDKSLGSIVSAESPLIYPVPFFDKWFLRALVEKETCNYRESIATIGNGRRFLKTTPADPEMHPWVVLCERKNLGTTCRRLKNWYKKVYDKKVEMALDDLDLLEIEIRDRLTPGQKEASTSKVRWPYAGENWKDELGHYSVPIESSCS